jgi:hypothetical protein
MQTTSPEAPRRRGLARASLLASGVLLTALGTAGVLLPLLPTTPFLLAAAACFARSSPTLHRRLLASRAFGPYLAQWERDRTVPRDAKRKAYVLVVATFAVSLWFADGVATRIALAATGLALLGFLAWLPVTRPSRTD